MEGQYKEIKLPYLISDGMILQRNETVRIWGWAIAKERVTLSFLGEEYQTMVSEEGTWEIQMMNLNAGGPYEMKISSAGQVLRLADILVGDVWVLGGQSNMELPVSRTFDLFEEEIRLNSDYKQIRRFLVPQIYNFHNPVEELTGGSWVEARPDTVKDFSAIGYFFAKEMYDRYKIPIGLIQTAIGGTPAETWMSEKSLLRFERFQELLSLCKDDTYVNGMLKREEIHNKDWYTQLDKRDKGYQEKENPWYCPEYNDTKWNEMDVPCSFRGTVLEKLKGSVWFRKEINLTKEQAGMEAKLVLGTIIDADDTYLNGVLIGNTGYQYPPRRYLIPKGLLKEGSNVLAVRVIVTQNIGAIVTDMPYFLKGKDLELPLTGSWKYQIGASMPAPEPNIFFHNKPIGLYNAMIYPLRKYNMKGVLWYQGESNDAYPYDYKDLFEAVIKDWRATWSLGDFPFYYVQLANYCPWRMEPKSSSWARIREGQRRIMELQGTGMVVAMDVGNYNDIHPQDKKSVGHRLALWVRKDIFGEDIEPSGPLFHHKELEEDKIRLYFSHTGGGLVAKGGELSGFTISGSEGIFMPAKACIDHDTVLVCHDSLLDAICVRYAWSDNPEASNLYNKEGLPASPFTT